MVTEPTYLNTVRDLATAVDNLRHIDVPELNHETCDVIENHNEDAVRDPRADEDWRQAQNAITDIVSAHSDACWTENFLHSDLNPEETHLTITGATATTILIVEMIPSGELDILARYAPTAADADESDPTDDGWAAERWTDWNVLYHGTLPNDEMPTGIELGEQVARIAAATTIREQGSVAAGIDQWGTEHHKQATWGRMTARSRKSVWQNLNKP